MRLDGVTRAAHDLRGGCQSTRFGRPAKLSCKIPGGGRWRRLCPPRRWWRLLHVSLRPLPGK